MSDLELHIYGGEGTRENSIYCAHSIGRSHEAGNSWEHTFYCPTNCRLWAICTARWEHGCEAIRSISAGSATPAVTHTCRPAWGPRRARRGADHLVTLFGDVNTVGCSVPVPQGSGGAGQRNQKASTYAAAQRLCLALAVPGVPLSLPSAGPVPVPCRAQGWGRPPSARDLDAKLASLVCERGSINTGHVPLPLAVGAAAGALTSRAPPRLVPAGVTVSSAAGTRRTG